MPMTPSVESNLRCATIATLMRIKPDHAHSSVRDHSYEDVIAASPIAWIRLAKLDYNEHGRSGSTRIDPHAHRATGASRRADEQEE
jgi:hypothetical protein